MVFMNLAKELGFINIVEETLGDKFIQENSNNFSRSPSRSKKQRFPIFTFYAVTKAQVKPAHWQAAKAEH